MNTSLRWLLAAAATLILAACGGGGGGGSGTTTTVTNCSLTGATSPAAATQNLTLGQAASLTPLPFTGNTGSASCAVAFSATILPPGLSINAQTGIITGTPSTAGTFNSEVTLRIFSTNGGSGDSVTRSVQFIVAAPVTIPSAAPSTTSLSWTILASNNGLPTNTVGRLNVFTIGSNLYALPTVISGVNYLPQLWKSTNSGVSWTKTAFDPPTPSGSLSSFSAVSDGTAIYLVGGVSSNASATISTFSNSIYSISPESTAPAWTLKTASAFPSARAMPALAYNNGVIYVHGGFTASGISQGFYSSTNGGVSWANLTSLGTPYMSDHCLLSSGNSLLIVGGYGGTDTSAAPTYSTTVYRSTDGGSSWASAVKSAPLYPYGVACAQLNGKVYITGGRNDLLVSSSVYTSSDFGVNWSLLATPTSGYAARRYHGLTTLGSSLIMVGGLGASSVLNDTLRATP